MTTFIKHHNHELLSPDEIRFLPANRIITQEDEHQILLYKAAGLNVRQIINVMELQKQVKHGDLSFMEKDVHNLFAKVRRMVGANDAMNLIDHMKILKQENPNFQYAFTVDDERRLENLFWCHSQSFSWYVNYGDVVVLDTTYKVKAYDMPCALFVGINNHGKTVLFGSALLRDETRRTFRWLMKIFVTIMKKPPKTIITDQDLWMMVCVEEFEQNWHSIVAKHNLENNKHVMGLYEIRKFWAPTYLRDYFFGGMTSTSRLESINAFIKKFVSSNTSLKDFVKQIDHAVVEIKKKESQDHMSSIVKLASNITSPLVEQAFHTLTPFAFNKFQEENAKASQYMIVQAQGNEFTIRYFSEGNHRNHMVFWDGRIALCSCKNFEFWGILCRHIFWMLNHKDCFEIPSEYLPLRWHRTLVQSDGGFQNVSLQETFMDNQPILIDNPLEGGDVLCPLKSVTKVRPKKRRFKGGKELAKKTIKTCSICKESGHTKPTCNNKENNASFETGSSNAKRKKCLASDMGLNPVFTLKY